MGRRKVQVQVSQQVANLPGELTYTNNTSDAQIQISPLGYNLGYRAERGRKREGDRGTVAGGRSGGGRAKGERLLYLNSHTRSSTI